MRHPPDLPSGVEEEGCVSIVTLGVMGGVPPFARPPAPAFAHLRVAGS